MRGIGNSQHMGRANRWEGPPPFSMTSTCETMAKACLLVRQGRSTSELDPAGDRVSSGKKVRIMPPQSGTPPR